ncbi:hypothetical protein GNX18_12135 [Microbulbifer sp. SH-1]|uniref:hypothetical protein n=1 Tax=Microbulbifer sp. SH-1 TaxID=2681547 RepID=UPI00140A6A62|nr:hypothetical protein [Microbulbifer sp. SH-1]QIL90420.1 hypothetical protein GNX18_12135 [Microbulbifer sp. SH-1]
MSAEENTLCRQVRYAVDRTDRMSLQSVTRHGMLAKHIAGCSDCRAHIQQQQLLRALAAMPVPNPGDDFEARMLTQILPRTAASPERPRARSPLVLTLGMAASLVLGMVLAPALPSPEGNRTHTYAAAQASLRPVHLRLDSPSELIGATIRVQLPAQTRLQGFGNLQTLQWQADIPAGGNRITLPLEVEGALSDSELIVEVEYQGAKKILRYAIPPAEKSFTKI